MIRWLRALCRINVEGPWTVPARGGGPALDRALTRAEWDDWDRELTGEARQLHRLSDVLYPHGSGTR